MNVKKNFLVLIFGVIAAVPIFVAGCSSQEAGGEEAVAVADSPGHFLFITKGCASCHGQNGEGTTIAPALAGHNELMVKNQVRNPRFQMPAFGPSQMTDQELQEIADYIAGLGGDGHEHHEVIEQTAAVEMHHWMALESLEAHDPAEAIHHVVHIIESLDPGDHRQRMQEILASLGSGGDTHEPEHQIEEMLAGSASPGLTIFQLHLKQALDSLGGEDLAGAGHHVGHAQEISDESVKAGLQEVLNLVATGNQHDAEHEIGEILGLEERHD